MQVNHKDYPPQWYRSTVAIVIYTITTTTAINTGIQYNLPNARADAYTSTMAKQRARYVDGELQANRVVMEQRAEALKEIITNEYRLFLAENYLTKSEIPPEGVEASIEHLQLVASRAERHIDHLDQKIDQIRERLTRCCYPHEINLGNSKDKGNRNAGMR